MSRYTFHNVDTKAMHHQRLFPRRLSLVLLILALVCKCTSLRAINTSRTRKKSAEPGLSSQPKEIAKDHDRHNVGARALRKPAKRGWNRHIWGQPNTRGKNAGKKQNTRCSVVAKLDLVKRPVRHTNCAYFTASAYTLVQ